MERINVKHITVYYDFLCDSRSDFLYSAAERFRADSGAEFELTKNDRGRPVLLNSEYDVSFTHTDNLCVCAFAKGRIGIDAEYVRTVDYDRIARRVFSAHDAALVTDINSFFRIWTRYEARYKLDNSLLTDNIKYYDVPLVPECLITVANSDYE